METRDLREKNSQELKKDLNALRARLAKIGFGISAKQMKNNSEIGKTRKNIAQILTILKEKEGK